MPSPNDWNALLESLAGIAQRDGVRLSYRWPSDTSLEITLFNQPSPPTSEIAPSTAPPTVAPPPSAAPPSSKSAKRSPDGGTEHWMNPMHKAWVAQIGAVDWGRMQRALTPVKDRLASLSPQAREACVLAWKAKRAKMTDRDRQFATVERWAQEIVEILEGLAAPAEPLVDDAGNLTEAGRRATS